MSVLHLVRKKYLRDERVLQLLLLLSLLRGSPEFVYENDLDLQNAYENDLVLGNALGHAQLSRYSSLTETLHPKSLDRVLANYQQSVLQDLNLLGNYAHSGHLSINQLGSFISHFDIQAYLLNAENSIGSTQPASVDGGYATTSSVGEIVEDNSESRHISSNQMWPRRNNDPFEELDILDTFLKQEIDLGIPRDIYEENDAEEEETDYSYTSKLDLGFIFPSTKDKDHGEEPMGGLPVAEIPDNKTFVPMLNATVKSEPEDFLSKNISFDEIDLGDESLPTERETSDSEVLLEPSFLDFNLDEALKFIGVNSSTASESKDYKDIDSDSGCGDSAVSESGADQEALSLDDLNDSLDEMIQASQLHHQHSRNFQGRLGGLVRSGSMEQRWQDLASFLSLPSPDSAHHAQSPPTPTMASHASSPVHTHNHTHQPTPVHHPHALYPSHEVMPLCPSTTTVPRGVLIHNVNSTPPMPDAHNITYANSIGASSHLVASSMNIANNSDLSGHDHQHYKMETSSTLPPDIMYYQNSGTEINQTTDGFLSSILNDEDLQLMDIPMNEYNGRSGGDYGAGSFRYVSSDESHRIPVVAQKKHQMFGKRFFHENAHGGPPSNNLGTGNAMSSGVPLVSSYTPPYAPAQGSVPMEGATAIDPSEMKYSCTMDFRPEVSASTLDHVQHNHTYHMSPEGPSGISRPSSRDKKGRKTDHEKSLSRDEKRARAMNLPITCEDIINLPMDEFNERISKYDLTEAQLSLIRDIRRRGKNKVAAQNCRKRKLDQIVHLAEEVKVIQYRKNELHSQLDHLSSERARVKHKFSLLYRHIFQALRDPDGNAYSPHEFSLQQSADGSIILVPRSSPSHSLDHLSTKGRNSKDD